MPCDAMRGLRRDSCDVSCGVSCGDRGDIDATITAIQCDAMKCDAMQYVAFDGTAVVSEGYRQADIDATVTALRCVACDVTVLRRRCGCNSNSDAMRGLRRDSCDVSCGVSCEEFFGCLACGSIDRGDIDAIITAMRCDVWLAT